ncbi:MAG: efflux RND transporter periplasmic adaptor subunit [Syntrophomonas sp.]|nr:efflux RND transporter periplasmic adaptor subunit [Syntrophomonas sp.]
MAGNETELMNAAVTRKSWPKPVKIILIVMLLVGLGVGTYYTYKSFNKKDPVNLTMPVTTGAIVDQIQATGTVKPLHEVDLFFRQQGTLKALNARSGDSVTEGQVLALQDDSSLQAQVQKAKSDLQQAQYKLQQTQLNYEKANAAFSRQDELYKQGAITKVDWEQAKRDNDTEAINIKTSQVSIENATATLVIAETNLKNAQLTAPFSGVAAQVNGEVGQETGNSSSPMFHLISNELQILAMVNEADIGRVKLNQEVVFTVTSYPGQSFQGTVARISPQSTAVSNVQLYEVDITAKDLSSQLRAGMSVTAKLIIDKRDKVTMVPNIAFSYTQTFLKTNSQSSKANSSGRANQSADGTAGTAKTTENAAPTTDKKVQRVVVLQDGKPVVKQITVGLSDGQNTEVIEGLNPGDQVVVGTNAAAQTTTSGNSNGQQSGGQQRAPGGGGIGGALH